MLPATDLAIIACYLVSVLVVGVVLALVKLRRERRKEERARSDSKARLLLGNDTSSSSSSSSSSASAQRAAEGRKGLEEYFLGGRRLPWWALAVADLSSYLDISGTMINSALLYALGCGGFYVEIRGGVCLMLAFQLAVTGKLNRRSMVLTKAEWMGFRFGGGPQGRAARLACALMAVSVAVLMVCYFAVGGGKFVTTFVDVPAWAGASGEFWGAAVLMGVASSYTVLTGFWSIVWTDVYQSLFIFFAFAYVGVRGFVAAAHLPDAFDVWLPARNGTLLPLRYTKEQWTQLWPRLALSSPQPPDEAAYAAYDLFGLAIGFYLLKAIVQSMGGPSGGGLQTVLAQRTDAAVAMQTMLAASLMAFRWLFSGAVAVLAVHATVQGLGKDDDGGGGGFDGAALDPERVLPMVLDALPVGGRGIVVSALLAAGLTTFDTTINAASAYCTLDLYYTFVHPGASKRRLLLVAIGSSLAVMAAGLALSLHVTNINAVWGFAMMGLSGSSIWPSFLAWYWQRANGYGFCAGTSAGLIAAVVQFVVWPDWTEYWSFCFSSAFSLVGTVAVSLATPATDMKVLAVFYRRTRPPGMWGRVVRAGVPGGKRSRFMRRVRRENRRDLISAAVAVPWQMALYLTMLALVMRSWVQFGVLAALTAGLSAALRHIWFKRLVRGIDDDAELLNLAQHLGMAESSADGQGQVGLRPEALEDFDHALYARLLEDSEADKKTSTALSSSDSDEEWASGNGKSPLHRAPDASPLPARTKYWSRQED